MRGLGSTFLPLRGGQFDRLLAPAAKLMTIWTGQPRSPGGAADRLTGMALPLPVEPRDRVRGRADAPLTLVE